MLSALKPHNGLPSTLTILNCGVNQLTSLPSLPSSLTSLSCYNNQLANLPSLPSSLTSLYCNSNQLISLQSLPSSLTILNCQYNQLTSLPALPSSLTTLECYANQITSLPALPSSLTTLNCYANQITSLPAFPSTLASLNCYANRLTSLPALPSSLTSLTCYNNRLTSLPALPSSLITLDCGGNQLTILPALPSTLTSLKCSYNQITTISTLPSNLATLNWSNNPVSCLPNIPATLTRSDKVLVLCNYFDTWTGTTSTNWNTASNWASNTVPTSIFNVTIPNTSRKPVISQNVTVKDLISSASITINSGFALTVTGNVSVIGSIDGTGTLVLNGSAAQTISGGTFTNVTVNNSFGVNLIGPITINGGLILQTGILASNGNLTLTSTRTSNAYVDDFSTGNTGTITGNVNYMRSSVTGNNQIASMLSGTTFSSTGRCNYVYDFNEANNTWTQKPLANCATPFTYGTSALFYSFNNNTPVNLRGTMNSGNQSFPIIRSSSSNLAGWNALGNPYLSPISWTALARVSGNTAVSNMAMYALNPATNTNAIVSANGITVNGGTPTVAVGQGFYLRRTNVGATGASINFNNSIRVATSNASMIRQASLDNSIRLSLQSSGKTEQDEIVIYHNENGTDLSKDNDLDAAKLPVETAYSELTINGANESLAIKALASNIDEIVVPLTVKAVSIGMHTISVNEMNLQNGAILWDKLNDTKTVLTANTKYVFTSDAGNFNNRFELIFGSNSQANVQKLNVYPNPAKDQFFINVVSPIQLQVLNTLGQVVINQTIDANSAINTASLPSGVYTLKAEGYKVTNLVVSK